MIRSVVSLSVLKQKAKQIKKAKSISLHQALNEAAKAFGFSNYKNYLNALKEQEMILETKKRVNEQLMAGQKRTEIFKKLESLVLVLQKLKEPFGQFVDELMKNDYSDEEIQEVCGQNIDLKKYLELKLLREFLLDEGADLDSEAPYHIAKTVTLKNLSYKTADIPNYIEDDGNSLYVEAEYDLTLNCILGHEPGEMHPFVQDRHASGFVELVVDIRGELNIDNMDIGWKVW